MKKKDSFDVKTIPKLLESNKTETYLNYVTGGVVGGSICGGLMFLLSPKIILFFTTTKLITTIVGVGFGSYIFDANSLNYYEKMNDIKNICMKNDTELINNLESYKFDGIYDNINLILNNSEHPIGEINYKYLEIYKRYDAPLHVLKYHINQLTDLIYYVYSINTYTQNIINYIKTCIEKSICNKMYNYITNIIGEMSIEYNTEFKKKKQNHDVIYKITNNILKYNLSYNKLIEFMNNIPKSTNPIDKVSNIEEMTIDIINQLKLKNKIMTADTLLDILSYVLIRSSINNPYDEITYMNKCMNDNSSRNEYLIVSFNAAVDYIRLL